MTKAKDGESLACGREDGSIEMRKTSDLSLVGSSPFYLHSGAVHCLRTLEDGTFVSGSSDKTMKRWDGYDGLVLQVFSGHRNTVSRIIELQRDLIVSASSNKELKIWRVSSTSTSTSISPGSRGVSLHTMTHHSNRLRGLVKVSSNDGLFATVALDNTVRVWNGSGACIKTIDTHVLGPTAMTRLGDTLVITSRRWLEITQLK